MPDYTDHAYRRMQQRGLSPSDTTLVMDHGTTLHRGGALFYFMAQQDLPEHLPGALKERLEGITVVVQPDTQQVLTVYRNPHALKWIRKKVPYDRFSGSAR